MNIIEYYLSKVEEKESVIMFDEDDNCYLSSYFMASNDLFRYPFAETDYGSEWVVITADKYKELAEYKIIVDEEVKDFDSSARRPYYRMRGKKIRMVYKDDGISISGFGYCYYRLG